MRTKSLILLLVAGILVNSGVVLAPLPEHPVGQGGYYVFPITPLDATLYITAIFNNTKVCTDVDRNLVCGPDETIFLNESQSTSTNAEIVLTDKPVNVIFKKDWNSGCSSCNYAHGIWGYAYGGSVLPSSSLSNEYVVPYDAGEVYIKPALYFTQVNVTNSSGTFSYTMKTFAEYILLSNPEPGTVIKSDKPVSVIFKSNPWNSGCTCSGYGIWGYAYGGSVLPSSSLSNKYVVPYDAGEVYITASQNDTTVFVDYNRDGLSDETYLLNSSEYVLLSSSTPPPLEGTLIRSDKPVSVIFKKDWNSGCSFCYGQGIWGYAYGGSVMLTKYLGEKYIVPQDVSEIYITPYFYNTNINITNSSGTFQNFLSAPNDYLVLSNPEPGTVITADKPVSVVFKKEWRPSGCNWCGGYGIWGYAYAGTLLPYDSPSTIIITPGMIGRNEYATITVRLFNPSDEYLYNVSLEIITHKNFTLVGDAGLVNITVYKKDANTDAVISSSTLQKSYSLVGENNVFVVNYNDLSFLSDLAPSNYVDVVYQVISTQTGYYTFEANSTWVAEHWST